MTPSHKLPTVSTVCHVDTSLKSRLKTVETVSEGEKLTLVHRAKAAV
jgi:hypothetical protein